MRTGTDIMVMATSTATATRTVTVMATATKETNTAATTGMVMDTAIPADPEWQNYSAGSLAPAITTDPSMEFWGPELAGLFAHTKPTTDMQTADRVSFA